MSDCRAWSAVFASKALSRMTIRSVCWSASAPSGAIHTGDLVALGTFFVGSLKGVGKIYLQSTLYARAEKQKKDAQA